MNEENNQKDTMLNRERENIVNASNEANRNIDEEKATIVNNAIKEEKNNTSKDIIKVVVIIVIILVIAIIGVILSKKLMESSKVKDNSIEEKITKPFMETYLENNNTVKKFEGNSSFNYNNTTYSKAILLLAPSNISKTYMLIYINDTSNYTEYGTYTINRNKLVLKSNNNTLSELEIKDKNITSFIDLKVMDSEMKSYKYSDSSNKKMLIINATLNGEYALYIDNDTTLVEKFVESPTNITVGNKVFTKNGNNIMIDNYTLLYVN